MCEKKKLIQGKSNLHLKYYNVFAITEDYSVSLCKLLNIKQSKLKKVNKIWWAEEVDHRSYCKTLTTVQSGIYVSYIAKKKD